MRELIRQKIVDSLSSAVPAFTRRDVHLPAIQGKAIAVIGMRRTGKSTFLWQVLTDRLSQGFDRESLLYFSFEDERLAAMQATDLQLLVEEYYRLHPHLRDRKCAVFFLDEKEDHYDTDKYPYSSPGRKMAAAGQMDVRGLRPAAR